MSFRIYAVGFAVKAGRTIKALTSRVRTDGV